MNLSSPLQSVSPSLESAVLEVLAGTESGLNAVQISRLSRRGTRTGQRPVLERLVHHGLVAAERANTGYLYRLNRAHLLAPAVLAAVSVRTELLSRLRAACRTMQPDLEHASVFGSFARWEAGPDSDIDLMLIVGDDLDTYGETWTGRLHSLQDDVQDWTGNRLEPLVLSRARFRDVVLAEEPVVGTWSADAVTLVGPEPTVMLTGTARPGDRRLLQ